MKPFYYVAEVVKVYDGDTCTCVVDLGFKLSIKIKVRLVGIDTPEIRTKDLEEKERGYASRDWLREQILGKKVLLHTSERGKFGRWLGRIWCIEETNITESNSYNQIIINEGHAKEYFGGKRK
jgi:endonuclease YncB( thermonuclease family)